MGNGSPKQRQDAIKKVRGRLEHLPTDTLEKLAKVPNNWAIPEGVATLSTATGNGDGGKFRLCFDHLNWNVCVFEFDETKAKALVRLFQKVTACEVRSLISSGIIRDNVSNTATYSSLFNGLSPDIEMRETELPGSGRVFFFVTGNKFNIVSIETKHRDPH